MDGGGGTEEKEDPQGLLGGSGRSRGEPASKGAYKLAAFGEEGLADGGFGGVPLMKSAQ